MNRAGEQSSYMRADEPVDCLGQIRIPVRYRLLLQPGREGGISSWARIEA